MGCDLFWWGGQPDKQLQAACTEDLARLAQELNWDYEVHDGSVYQPARVSLGRCGDSEVSLARHGVVVFPWNREGELAREISFTFVDGPHLPASYRHQICTCDLEHHNPDEPYEFLAHGYWRQGTREIAALSYLLQYIKRLYVPGLDAGDDYNVCEDAAWYVGREDLFAQPNSCWFTEIRKDMVSVLGSWLSWEKTVSEFAILDQLHGPYLRFLANAGSTTPPGDLKDVEWLKRQLAGRYGVDWPRLSENLLFFLPSSLRDLLRTKGLQTLGTIIEKGPAYMPDQKSCKELFDALAFLIWPENPLNRHDVTDFLMPEEVNVEEPEESPASSVSSRVVLASKEAHQGVLDWLRMELQDTRMDTLEQLYMEVAQTLPASPWRLVLHHDGVAAEIDETHCTVITFPDLLEALRFWEDRFSKPFEHLIFTMDEFEAVYAGRIDLRHRKNDWKDILRPLSPETRRRIFANLWDACFRPSPPRLCADKVCAHELMGKGGLPWYYWREFFIVPQGDHFSAFRWEIVPDSLEFIGALPRITHSVAPLLLDLGDHFSVRTTRELRKIGMTTLGDIVPYSLDELVAAQGDKSRKKYKDELTDSEDFIKRVGFGWEEDLKARLLGVSGQGGPWHRFLAYVVAANASCQTCAANRANAREVEEYARITSNRRYVIPAAAILRTLDKIEHSQEAEDQPQAREPYCSLRAQVIHDEELCFCAAWSKKSGRYQVRSALGPVCRRCAGGESGFDLLG